MARGRVGNHQILKGRNIWPLPALGAADRCGLIHRVQCQFWHGEVFPVVGQQGEIVVKGDCGYGDICQRKGMPLPAPLISEGTSPFRDLLGHIVIEEPVHKSSGDLFLARPHAGVYLDQINCAISKRVAWLEELANEIAASAAVIDQVNDERSVGEVVGHFNR
jgi:hypothetical protein